MKHFDEIALTVCSEMGVSLSAMTIGPRVRITDSHAQAARCVLALQRHSSMFSLKAAAERFGARSSGTCVQWIKIRDKFAGMYPGGLTAEVYADEVAHRAIGGAA